VLVCSNVRGGPVFAVADAYKEWYDLGDDEVVSLLEASGLSGS
jgi:predicted phosphoribosyltransferase